MLAALPTKAVLHEWAKAVANGPVLSTSFSALVKTLPLTVIDLGQGTAVWAVKPFCSKAYDVTTLNVEPGGTGR